VVVTKIADGRREKKNDLHLLANNNSIPKYAFKLNISKVLTSTTKKQQNSTKTIFWKQRPTLSSLINYQIKLEDCE